MTSATMQVAPSLHALLRMSQRAIKESTVAIILQYGEMRRSGKDFLMVLTDRALRGTPFEALVDRLRGLSVIVTPDGILRTVQRLYQVRRKPGILRGRSQRAVPAW